MHRTSTTLRLGQPLSQLGLLLIGLLAAAALYFFGTGGAQAGEAVGKIFHWQPFLGPFHAVVLHFPIGFLTIAFLLEAYRAFRPSDELRHVTVLVLWLSLATGVISAVFGLMRASGEAYDPQMLQLHKIFGLGVPIATALTLTLQWLANRDETHSGWTRRYRAVLAATIMLVVVAGHYGGNLTHGSKYLVENAPEFLKVLLAENSPAASEADPGMQGEQMLFYEDKVKPILEAKCNSCHGPEKQKGGYRVDEAGVAFKGGDSGNTAIKPGYPLESDLIRLILLPPADDDVMPPEGKQPLKSEEIMVLIDWIRNGAAFPGSGSPPSAINALVKDAPPSSSISMVESRIHGAFEGWTGDTTFRLINGEVWQQASASQARHDAFRPKVTIVKDGPAFIMKVDGMADSLPVKQIK